MTRFQADRGKPESSVSAVFLLPSPQNNSHVKVASLSLSMRALQIRHWDCKWSRGSPNVCLEKKEELCFSVWVSLLSHSYLP
jgi:hypothetical protein